MSGKFFLWVGKIALTPLHYCKTGLSTIVRLDFEYALEQIRTVYTFDILSCSQMLYTYQMPSLQQAIRK
jgi:hypothetical protein